MDFRGRRNSGGSYTDEQVKRVLVASGIDIALELDHDFMVFCPFHPNSRTPAAEINKESGQLFCFACQKTADLTETVMHVTNRKYFEAARLIASKAQDSKILDQINKKLDVEPEYLEFDQVIISRLNSQAIDSPRAIGYYSKRMITQDSIKKFLLGYSEKQDMVTIPVHSPDGLPVGFVGRSIDGKDFKNTPGMPKSKVLFNLHRVKSAQKIYVVESSFDAIRLDQCGFPAVATLGANVSRTQISLLQKYYNDIIVIADNDEAGGNMKSRIQEKLGSRVSVVQLDKQYKDIGDMSDDDIKNLEISFDKSIANMLN